MKRTLLLLLAAIVVGSGVYAQSQTVWEKTAVSSYTWFNSSVYSIAYNPITDHLLVARRDEGIHIINAATGDELGTLPTTGITVGSYTFNKIRVDENGVIYAVPLKTGAGSMPILRWENETSDPTVAISHYVTQRVGDSFGLSGSGSETVLYAFGSTASTKIYRFTTTDGVHFAYADTVEPGTALARGGIEPVTTGLSSDMWINSPGNPLYRISATGTKLNTVSSTIVANNYGPIKYYSANGYNLLAVTGFNNNSTGAADGLTLKLIDVTNPAQPKEFETLSLTNAIVNQSGAGDAAFKDNGDGSFTVFQLVLSNGIAAYNTKTASAAPVFSSLAPTYYTVKDSISLASTSYGAKFYYTVNGSDPDSVTGTKYTGPFSVSANGTEVKAVAYGAFRNVSSVTSYVVALPTQQAATPSIELSGIKDFYQLTQKVGIASTEASAEIFYTTDGAEPNYNSSAYTDSVALSFGQTIKAIVYAPDRTPSAIASATAFTPSDTVKTVAFSLPGGLYQNSPVKVALTSETPDAKIYFTLDGSTPSYLDSLYADTLLITPDEYSQRIVKAVAYAAGFYPAAVDSAVYTFPAGPKLPVPSFEGKYDFYKDEYFVVINTGDTAKAYYTLDGSMPALTSTEYADTLALAQGVTVKALAYAAGYTPSDVDSIKAEYPSDTVKALVFTPAAGSYEDNQLVSISTETENAFIYYTLDGTAPSYSKGTIYTAPVEVALNTTLKAVAYAADHRPGKVKTGAYSVKAEELYSVWGHSPNFGGVPTYFGTNTERGMAYGKVDGNDRVYVISRNSTPVIYAYDAFTGDSVGTIAKPAVDKGLFPINTVEVSEDGILFASNLTLDANSTNPFVVYRWDTETSTPTEVINYQGAGRLGDMFSVYGKASDNSLTIFACVSAGTKVVKFTTTDNGHSFTPSEMTLSGADVSTSPNVALTSDGTFYFTSYGRDAVHYSAAGSPIDTVNSNAVPKAVSRIKYLENSLGKFLVTYQPDPKGEGTGEKVSVVNLNSGDKKAYVEMYSPAIGKVANSNAVGAIAFKAMDNNEYMFFVLGTNNGFAAFATSPQTAFAQYDTLFYGTSKNVLPNPSGAGYIAGVNSRGDLGKYQKFEFNSKDELKGFNVQFAFAAVKNTADTFKVVVRSVSAAGAPEDLLAEFSMTTDMVNTNEGNSFILNSPLKLTGPAFIGVEWESSFDDTLAIFSDKDGEGDNANGAWEKYSNGSFGSFSESGAGKWDIDADLWIYAFYKAGEIIGIEDGDNTTPEQYVLNQNYPNPFNPSTTISFALRVESKVSLKIYNILGQEVATLVNENMRAGNQNVKFNAANLSSGVYIYRLDVKGADGSSFTSSKKMMFLK